MTEKTTQTIVSPDGREVTFVREFEAPREKVFKAWTDPKLLARWWGPAGFTTPISELDARPGGSMNIVMEDEAGLIAKGSRYPMVGTFKEVAAPHRIVFESQALLDDKPMIESTVTVTLEEANGKTVMRLHALVTKATAAAEMPLKGMVMGWSQSLDKLAKLLKT